MTIASVSRGSLCGVPEALGLAQEAIYLPDVQDMLRRLSEYGLGVFMPHMHDERTGEFQPLPEQVIQVESDLTTSFQRAEDVLSQADRYLPVGWFWRAGAARPTAVCEMVWEEGRGDADRTKKHKMRRDD